MKYPTSDESDEPMKPAAVVNDQYSRDGVNDEISAFLPVGTHLYTAAQIEDLRSVLARERAKNSELFSEYYNVCAKLAAAPQPTRETKYDQLGADYDDVWDS